MKGIFAAEVIAVSFKVGSILWYLSRFYLHCQGNDYVSYKSLRLCCIKCQITQLSQVVVGRKMSVIRFGSSITNIFASQDGVSLCFFVSLCLCREGDCVSTEGLSRLSLYYLLPVGKRRADCLAPSRGQVLLTLQAHPWTLPSLTLRARCACISILKQIHRV